MTEQDRLTFLLRRSESSEFERAKLRDMRLAKRREREREKRKHDRS